MDLKPQYAAHKVKKLYPLNDTIIVSDMVFDERITHGGIVLLNDDMKRRLVRKISQYWHLNKEKNEKEAKTPLK